MSTDLVVIKNGRIRQQKGPIRKMLDKHQIKRPVLSFLVAPVIKTISVKAPKAKITAYA